MLFRRICLVLAVCALVIYQVAGEMPVGTPQATAGAIAACLPTGTSDRVGDVNCDGRIDAVDATLVLQYVAGLLPTEYPANYNFCRFAASSVSGMNDVEVNAIDALLILQYEAGLMSYLPGYTGTPVACYPF